jgi:hypothetical protein
MFLDTMVLAKFFFKKNTSGRTTKSTVLQALVESHELRLGF